MVKLAATELRSHFSETISRVAYRGERIMLERNGKPVAGLVSPEDLHLLEAIRDGMDVKAVRQALKERGRTPWAQVKKDLGL